MKFLFVSDFVPAPDSGSAGSVLAIGDALSMRGHRVDYEWRSTARRRIPHHTASVVLELPRIQLRQVARRLDGASYDVVVASQPYAYLMYERLPRLHPHTLFLNRTHGWEDRLYRAYRRFRWDPPAPVWRRVVSYAAERAIHRACVRTVTACQGLIAPSSRCAEFVRATYGVADDKVTVAPYGVDEAFLRQPRTSPTPHDGLRLLYVGHYMPGKGSTVLETVLSPFARRYADVRLTLVVDPASVEEVRRRYEPAFGDRLSVRSWTPRDQLRSIYAEHDLLLHPSFFEGFGKAWQEAMACGLCVVGFGEGGLPDVATNERDAFFCDVGDLDAYRALLDRCLADPLMARDVGARARSVIREYTWDRTAVVTEDFCERRRQTLV
ncbi:MAG: glycosyltransferase family 4 protein [Gemmatimonadetes bacterium]|nr:glycosyltransferase family 4 protein [Gemmatimonadota bacterium]